MSAAFTVLAGASALAAATCGRLWRQRLSVLIFHRVLRELDPLFPEEVDAARFDALLGLLARAFDVLPLARALALADEGRLPPRALAITFDDGYADNAEVALPLLQRHGLTATFFIATGFLDGGRMFNDSVIECVRRSRLERADLGALGLGEVSLADTAARRALIGALLPKVKYSALAEREAFVATLHAALGAPELPQDLMMRSTQVQQLHRAGMSIGGHTVDHPILRLLPDAAARAQIADGRARLETLLDAPVTLFAYPNGKPGQDYDARHVTMVRELGFAAAVSTAYGVASARAPRFELPRFTPWDHGLAPWALRLLHSRMRAPELAL